MEEDEQKLIVYKRRWFVLFIVAGLNIVNGGLWISFAPISNDAATYYQVTVNTINWLSIVFFIVAIPFAILASKLSDSKGLKFMIHVGALCNIVGAIFRVIGSLEVVPIHYHIYLTMIGQVIAAIGQSFIYIIPTRVSEVWFPENQRTISTTVIALANPIGAALSNVISPSVLHSVSHHSIFFINVIWAVSACFFGLCAFLIIQDSEPPTPPSLSANTLGRTQSFGVSVKQLFANKQYIILFITLGIGIGIVSCVQTVIDQLLCPKGYSNGFAGICGGLITGSGVFGAFISSVMADKTKKLEEIAKVCFGFAAISLSLLSVFLQFENNNTYNQYYIAILFALFGTCAVAGFPIALELAAENTYPVNETLSGGFILMSGQIVAIIFIIILEFIGQPFKAKDLRIQTCTTSADTSQFHNMTNAVYTISGCLVVAVIIFIITFKADYKRMRSEQIKAIEKILSGSYQIRTREEYIEEPNVITIY